MKHEFVGVNGDSMWFIKGHIVLCTLDEPDRRVRDCWLCVGKVRTKISCLGQIVLKSSSLYSVE